MITVADYMLLVKNCARIRGAKPYQKNRERVLEKTILYRENNKDEIKHNRKTISSLTQDVQNIYNEIDKLTEMLKSTTITVS